MVQIVLPRQVVFTLESNQGLIQQFERVGRLEFTEPFLDALDENPDAQSFIIELEPTMVLRLKDFLATRRSPAFTALKKQLQSLERDAKPIRQQDVLRVALTQLGLQRLEQIRTEDDREQLALALANLGAKPSQVTRSLRSAMQRTRLKDDVGTRESIKAIARSLRTFELIGKEAKGAMQLFPSSERAQSRPLVAPEVSKVLGAKKARLQEIFDVKRAEVAGRTAGIIEGAIAQSEKEVRRAGKATARGVGKGTVAVGRGAFLGSRAVVRVGAPAARRGAIKSRELARRGIEASKPKLALAGKRTLAASREGVRFTREEVLPAARGVASDVATTIGASTAIAVDKAVAKARDIGRKIEARDKIAITRFQAFEAAREDKATKISNILFEVGIGPEEWNPLKADERRKLLQESVSPEEFPKIADRVDFSFKIPFSPLRRVEELKGTLPERIAPKEVSKTPTRLAVGEQPSIQMLEEAKEVALEFGASEEVAEGLGSR